MRSDGRSNIDYRPMELESDVVSHASGSSRLRLANTDILVGVKTEIDTPSPNHPGWGKIDFFVDWYVFSINQFNSIYLIIFNQFIVDEPPISCGMLALSSRKRLVELNLLSILFLFYHNLFKKTKAAVFQLLEGEFIRYCP